MRLHVAVAVGVEDPIFERVHADGRSAFVHLADLAQIALLRRHRTASPGETAIARRDPSEVVDWVSHKSGGWGTE